jgi:hypothetical protein
MTGNVDKTKMLVSVDATNNSGCVTTKYNMNNKKG